MASEFVPLEQHMLDRFRRQEVPADAVSERPPACDAHDLRRFYAAVADAVDVATRDLLEDIASDVLARELALAPADVLRVVEGTLARFHAEMPLRVLAHHDDVLALQRVAVPVQADETLRRGDVTIVLRYGTIDASLGARLSDVLRSNEP